MARPKCLMIRLMPYTTMLNRARMLKKLGWDVYLIHDQPFANSRLLISSAKVFEDIWSQHFLLSDTNSMHDFIRSKGFDLLYTIGPPDRLNVNFMNAPCPWIHDLRDLQMLCTPHADDMEVLKKAQAEYKHAAEESTACVNGSDLAVFVTPWQRAAFNKRVYGNGKPKPSAWLPNVPWFLPEVPENPDKDPDVLHWGYTGNMKAAWQNAPDWVGQVASALSKQGVEHNFHFWSMMEMHESQPIEWFIGHSTQEQHDMIAEMGSWIDYGIVSPPTKSDGTNGQTGWPGKVGDYVAGGCNVFVPDTFKLTTTLQRNGWGWGYDSPKDVARIMASGRKPTNERKPALHLQMPAMMEVLQNATYQAHKSFQQRYSKPIQVVVKDSMEKMIVASDGNAYHAKTHIAPIWDAPWRPIAHIEKGDLWPEPENYENLYMLGFWARDEKQLQVYEEFMSHFKRIVVQWAGSDVGLAKNHAFIDWVLKLLQDPKVTHFAPHRALANEVKAAIDRPCAVLPTPTRHVYDKPFRLPKPFAVSVYYPNISGFRDLYRLDLVDEVIERMPNTLFFLHAPQVDKVKHDPKLTPNAHWLGPVGSDIYPEFLKNVSVFLRLTKHDGLPMSAVEHFCAGRRVIGTMDLPFVELVEPDAAEIIKAINLVTKEKKPHIAASDYWRMWNDYDRYRKNVKNLFAKCEVESSKPVVEAAA